MSFRIENDVLELNIQEKINKQLVDKLQLAYVCVDHSMLVKEVSRNLGDYGFGEIPIGITRHVISLPPVAGRALHAC